MRMKTLMRAATLAPMILATVLLTTASTPAGEKEQEAIAMAWIEAHNAGDEPRMAAFRERHFRRSTVTDWQDGFRRMRDELGSLMPMTVHIEAAGVIVVGVESEKTGKQVDLRFEFHTGAPDQLAGIGMDIRQGGGRRRENPLPPLEGGGTPAARSARIDRYLQQLAEQGVFSGAVMVGNAKGILYRGSVGPASREFGVPNTFETRFDVGSCTKDFTRQAIFQLADRGKLSLDDTVGEHLPDYPNPEVRKKVTIAHLLEHRSGLGDYFTEEWNRTPMGNLRHVEDYIPIWGPKPLEAKPGERESYSNFGFTVLGAIIEKASGMRYPDYIVKHVFEPVGMSRSGFFATDAVVPDIAVGYTLQAPDGSRREEPAKNIYMEPALGGPWGKSYSTIDDFYRYYSTMLDGEFVAGEGNRLAGRWESGGIALAGGGPGLNAIALVDGGMLITVLANMDPPIAMHVAGRLQGAFSR